MSKKWTYPDIQQYVKEKYNESVKTCHIAHAKQILGYDVKPAHNRVNEQERKYPCPEEFVEYVKEAIEYYEQ